MAEVRAFTVTSRPVNAAALKLIEETLARVKAGEVVSVAIIEVRPVGAVAVAWSKGDHYHQMNSGAARLAAQLASAPDDG